MSNTFQTSGLYDLEWDAYVKAVEAMSDEDKAKQTAIYRKFWSDMLGMTSRHLEPPLFEWKIGDVNAADTCKRQRPAPPHMGPV